MTLGLDETSRPAPTETWILRGALRRAGIVALAIVVAALLVVAPTPWIHTAAASQGCRRACYETTPRGSCRKARKDCLLKAGDRDAKHECRLTFKSCVQGRKDCLRACQSNPSS